MSFVLDASVALAWCFEDEQTPPLMSLLDELGADGAAAPQLWPLETLNGLASAQRRGRLTAAERRRLASLLAALPVSIDGETATRAWASIAGLAETHGLTPYDAAYLELALRLTLPLATTDRSLAAAARASGVAVRPEG